MFTPIDLVLVVIAAFVVWQIFVARRVRRHHEILTRLQRVIDLTK